MDTSKYQKHSCTAAKLLIWIGLLSLPGLVGSAVSYLYLVPCDLGNLGYMYVPPCNLDLHTTQSFAYFFGTVLRTLSPGILGWIVLHTFARCITEYTIFSSVHCYCLINYLHLFQRRIFNSKLIDVRMFKEIQILTLIYNNIHQGSLTCAGTTLCIYIFITSFYAVISLSQYLILPQFILFGSLAFDGVILTVIMDGAFKAGVYRASKKVMNSVTNVVKGTQVRNSGSRLNRRYVKSWPICKIFIADGNFYDDQIALVLLHFNISQVVNLLLM